MTNHVHLLLTPSEADSIPLTMQSLGRRYVRHVNTVYRRTGTLWEGRYKAALIDSDAYLLACHRYIELNPLRAGMVSDPLVEAHPLYLALGKTPGERCAAYLGLFRESVDPRVDEDLREATNGGWVFGGEAFKRRIASATGRRVAPLPRGRPRKPLEEDS